MPFLLSAAQFALAYWKPLAFAVAVAGAFLSGWTVKSRACENETILAVSESLTRQRELFEFEQDKANEKGERLEKALAANRATIRNLNERLKDDVEKNPVYVQCRPTVVGLRNINATIAARKGNAAP